MKIQLYSLILLGSLTLSCDTNKSSKKLPNIILIMADDMGVEALGCYGNLYNKTPNIDLMASRGILFKNCISQPLCTPSRVKIMTGLYNYRNYDYFGYLNANQRTFGNLFQEKGYATCIAGKWQLNGLAYTDEIDDWSKPSRPNDFGFDEYSLWQLTKPRSEGERFSNPLIEQNGKTLPRDKDQYGPDIFSQFILDFIEKKQDQPFFVYYPMVLVHDPFVPTPDSEEWEDESRRYENDTTYFKDMVQYTDKIVGQINAKLKELGIEEETIFIFAADNGTHPSIYSSTQHGIVQGGKGNTTNAGTQVPLIINWGDEMKESFEYEGLIEFSDFYATFSDLLAEDQGESDGKSFLNLLKGEHENNTRETAFVHYDPKWGKNVNKFRNQFIRTKRYKLYQDGSFYDLEADRLELHKLAEDSLSKNEQLIRRKLVQELSAHPKWEE